MAGYIVEFRDEVDKQTLVEKAQNAKEVVCDLWDEMAKHMPELHQVQERRYYNRGGYGMTGSPSMGYGMGANVGYRNYGGGGYRDGYQMGYGPSMGGYGGYRENPAYTGPGDHRYV